MKSYSHGTINALLIDSHEKDESALNQDGQDKKSLLQTLQLKVSVDKINESASLQNNLIKNDESPDYILYSPPPFEKRESPTTPMSPRTTDLPPPKNLLQIFASKVHMRPPRVYQKSSHSIFSYNAINIGQESINVASAPNSGKVKQENKSVISPLSSGSRRLSMV